ncbi:MAG: hypothetical protein AB7O98_08310 [Hyphomonadaceae bacterium]
MDRWAAFHSMVLRGEPAPADLRHLFDAHGSSDDPLAALGVRFIDPDNLPVLLSHSNLTDQDRANADIMSNVAAINDVFAMSVPVAELDDGEIVGFWRGPENTPLDQCAIFEFDTEGQFALLGGVTFSEALLGRCLRYDRSAYDRVRAAFSKVGIVISTAGPDDLREPIAGSDPRVIHRQNYNRHRAGHGLPPV